jgi:hypothetical protein
MLVLAGFISRKDSQERSLALQLARAVPVDALADITLRQPC